MIGGQKWTVILGMSWLARHNPEIDWRTGEVKINKVSRGMWQVVETSTGKIRMGEAEGRRSERKQLEGRERKKTKRKKTEKKERQWR